MKFIDNNVFKELLYYASPKGVKSENVNGGPLGANKNVISDYYHHMTPKQREQEHLAYINIHWILSGTAELNRLFDKS